MFSTNPTHVRVVGDEDVGKRYLGVASKFLAMLKARMKANDILALTWRRDLGDGVVIEVRSAYGIDHVTIYAPGGEEIQVYVHGFVFYVSGDYTPQFRIDYNAAGYARNLERADYLEDFPDPDGFNASDHVYIDEESGGIYSAKDLFIYLNGLAVAPELPSAKIDRILTFRLYDGYFQVIGWDLGTKDFYAFSNHPAVLVGGEDWHQIAYNNDDVGPAPDYFPYKEGGVGKTTVRPVGYTIRDYYMEFGHHTATITTAYSTEITPTPAVVITSHIPVNYTLDGRSYIWSGAYTAGIWQPGYAVGSLWVNTDPPFEWPHTGVSDNGSCAVAGDNDHLGLRAAWELADSPPGRWYDNNSVGYEARRPVFELVTHADLFAHIEGTYTVPDYAHSYLAISFTFGTDNVLEGWSIAERTWEASTRAERSYDYDTYTTPPNTENVPSDYNTRDLPRITVNSKNENNAAVIDFTYNQKVEYRYLNLGFSLFFLDFEITRQVSSSESPLFNYSDSIKWGKQQVSNHFLAFNSVSLSLQLANAVRNDYIVYSSTSAGDVMPLQYYTATYEEEDKYKIYDLYTGQVIFEFDDTPQAYLGLDPLDSVAPYTEVMFSGDVPTGYNFDGIGLGTLVRLEVNPDPPYLGELDPAWWGCGTDGIDWLGSSAVTDTELSPIDSFAGDASKFLWDTSELKIARGYNNQYAGYVKVQDTQGNTLEFWFSSVQGVQTILDQKKNGISTTQSIGAY